VTHGTDRRADPPSNLIRVGGGSRALKESSGHPGCSGCWVEWWRGYRGRTA
jgi:hypothetical protein